MKNKIKYFRKTMLLTLLIGPIISMGLSAQEKKVKRAWETYEVVYAPKFDSPDEGIHKVKVALLFLGDEFKFDTEEENSYSIIGEGTNFYNKYGELVYKYTCQDMGKDTLDIYLTDHAAEWSAMFTYSSASYVYYMNELNP